MKSDLNNKRQKGKISYKESNEDDESYEDIERKRIMKPKKPNKKQSAKKGSDDDEDFIPELERNDISEDELSMEVDSESLSKIEKNNKTKKVKKTTAKANKSSNEITIQTKDVLVKNKETTIIKEKKNKSKKADKDIVSEENSEKASKKESAKEKKEKKIKEPKDALDLSYDIEKNYFYQDLSTEDIFQIKQFFEICLNDKIFNKKDEYIQINSFLSKFPNLKKGKHNVEQLKFIIDNILEKIRPNVNIVIFEKYRLIMDIITNEYYTYKPVILEAHFFPNPSNEIYVVNMIRTCKESLDIAIFTLTNDKIAAAIIEAFERKIKVRIIADDECCKMWGSDIVRLAAKGIPVKTDNKVNYHMHHKFAILDKSVVLTGSFNWTAQAVKFNQENIVFYENKELAMKYFEAYENLWNGFTTIIGKEEAIKIIEEQNKIKEEKMEQKRLEKEQKKNGKDKDN